jgi:phospholipase/carboxylesterase
MTMTNAAFEIAEADLGLEYRARAAIDSGGGPAPCLILLHGVGRSETSMISTGLRQDPRLLVIVPRGPLVLGSNQFAWFQVAITPEGPVIKPEQERASRKLLIEFIDALPRARNVDPKRIWIAGFSQGGVMSAGVALVHPEKVAGFGMLGSRILPEIAPLIASAEDLKKLSGYVSHGVQDSVLGIDNARNSHRLLTEKGVRHAYGEYEGEHELTERMQADFSAWMSAQVDASDAGAPASVAA